MLQYPLKYFKYSKLPNCSNINPIILTKCEFVLHNRHEKSPNLFLCKISNRKKKLENFEDKTVFKMKTRILSIESSLAKLNNIFSLIHVLISLMFCLLKQNFSSTEARSFIWMVLILDLNIKFKTIIHIIHIQNHFGKLEDLHDLLDQKLFNCRK